jgi:hypothetical protein
MEKLHKTDRFARIISHHISARTERGRLRPADRPSEQILPVLMLAFPFNLNPLLAHFERCTFMTPAFPIRSLESVWSFQSSGRSRDEEAGGRSLDGYPFTSEWFQLSLRRRLWSAHEPSWDRMMETWLSPSAWVFSNLNSSLRWCDSDGRCESGRSGCDALLLITSESMNKAGQKTAAHWGITRGIDICESRRLSEEILGGLEWSSKLSTSEYWRATVRSAHRSDRWWRWTTVGSTRSATPGLWRASTNLPSGQSTF